MSSRTCDTPDRSPCVPCAPQLPVASEYFRPRVMVCVLMALGTLISLPLSTHLPLGAACRGVQGQVGVGGGSWGHGCGEQGGGRVGS